MTKIANILVIDDDKVIQDSCSLILKKEGYKVQLASDGEEGLLAFRKESSLISNCPAWMECKF
jgi:DNA-binding response OmpR family regulator